jgi:PUA-domain protein
LLIKKRHPLSTKDLKALLDEAARVAPTIANHIDKKKAIELLELESGERLFYQNGKPLLIEHSGKIMPSLAMPQELLDALPKVVVDMGAVRFVVNGATIMAPGIRSVQEGVKIGDVVLVVDEKYSKGLAIGVLLMERAEILGNKKGKAVKNVHHVGDEVWNSTKACGA